MGEGGKVIEKTIFWGALVGAVPIWILFGAIAVLKLDFKWLVLVGLALILALGNIIGYARCLASKKDKLKSIATAFITKKAVEHVTNNPSSISNYGL